MKKLGIFLLALLFVGNSLAYGATLGPRETLPVPDTTSIVEGSADATKEIRFEVDGLTTATTRVLTALDRDVTLGLVGSGSTVPTTGLTEGEFFLHTPTGRKFYLIYNGGSWKPFISVGDAIIHVDGNGTGTDTINNGGATGASAFNTGQYAIDQVPGLLGGDVTIIFSGETYTENLIVQGKTVTGNFNLVLEGTLTEDASATLDSAVKGTAGTQGSITDTGAFGSFDNQLIYSTSEDKYRLITSDTANTATIVGTWVANDLTGSAPTGNYKVYDWATIISGTIDTFGQKGLIVRGLDITGRFTPDVDSEVFFQRSKIENRIQVDRASFATLEETLVTTTNSVSVNSITGSFVRLYRSKLLGISSPARGLRVGGGSGADVDRGTVIDGYDNGIIVEAGAVRANNSNAPGYMFINNCTNGGVTIDGGTIYFANGVRASTDVTGTTTPWTPSAASDPAFIGN